MIVTKELLNCVNLFEETLKNIGDFRGTFSDSELRMICEWKYALNLEYNHPTQNRIILVTLDDTSVDTIRSILALPSKSVLRLPDDKVKILSLVVGVPESDCDINITVQKSVIEKSNDKNVNVGMESFTFPSNRHIDNNDHDDSDDDDDDDDISDDDNFSAMINENRLPYRVDASTNLPKENIGHPMVPNDGVNPYLYA